MTKKVELERYLESGACERTRLEPQTVVPAVRAIASQWSATLFCEDEQGDAELMITSSEGRYAALLRVGEAYYDLVGDRLAAGMIDMAHGGQLAPHPIRHVVDNHKAERAAAAFVDSGAALLHNRVFDWEEQGATEKAKASDH